ncbi:hypothetical protein J2X02_001812 [Pseudoxanthomonas japonensis]|nr:hypothetical protein [Pseudoxanthomonas japonensis]
MGFLLSSMVPLAAGAFFLCLCKERSKETHPRRHALRAARFASASGPGISVRHIHVPYGNAAHPERRPAGFTRPTRRASWGQKAQSDSVHVLGIFVFISGAPEVRQSWRVKPRRGGAQGCAPFSAGAGCLVRKFPPRLRTRRVAAGGPPGGVSFAYFSLHKQRKVGPPRRAAACLNKRRSVPQGHRTRGHRGRGDNTGRPEDTDFVAPHPNPSPGGREA